MRALLAAALLGSLAAAAGANTGEDEATPSLDVYVDEVQHLDALSDDRSGKAYGLIGRITLRVGELFRIRAGRVVVWIDPKAEASALDLVEGLQGEQRRVPLWAVRAIYAQGGRAPALFETTQQVFRCSSFYYDFRHFRGLIVDAEIRLRRTLEWGREKAELGELPDFVLRARRMHSTRPGQWFARDVILASTDYQDPEIDVTVERVILRDEPAAELLGRLMRMSARARSEGVGIDEQEMARVLSELDEAERSIGGKQMRLEAIRPRLWGVPFFRWKGLDVDGDSLIDLRVEVEFGNRGQLGPGARVGVGLNSKPVGFLVGAAYYLDRGPLFDLTLDVDAFEGRVRGRSYIAYLRDHGQDFGIEPPTPNRYWTKNQYRWRIADHWRLDGEFADLSDPLWLRVYDEAEFKEGKEQETLLYLRRRDERTYVTLTAKVQTIEFQHTVEQLPNLQATLPTFTLLKLGESGGEPVVLQLAGQAQLGNLRLQPGELDPGPSLRTARFDTDPTLFVAFDAGPVRIVPWGTFRFTAYEDSFRDESLARFAGSAGLRGDLQVSRRFGSHRHVVNISVEYADMYAVTESATDLFPMDAVDRITPFNQLGIRIRNRLQRQRPWGLEEWLNFEVFAAWYPEGERPQGETGSGLVELDLEWRRRDLAGVSARASIELEDGELATGALEGWTQLLPRLRVAAGLRHLEGDSDILTTSAELGVDSRWRLLVFSQIDFKNSDFLDQGLLIQRFGQTAVFGFRIAYDPGDNGVSFSLKLDLMEAFRAKQRKWTEDYRNAIGWR